MPLSFCVAGQDRLDPDGAFQTLSLGFATEIIGLHEIAVAVIGIGVTATAAVELCPTVSALVLVVNMGPVETVVQTVFKHRVFYVAQEKFRISHELMARVKISFRRDSDIFSSRAAARNTLDHAGALSQVDAEVEKGKGLSPQCSIQILLSKRIVLLKDAGKVFLFQSVTF